MRLRGALSADLADPPAQHLSLVPQHQLQLPSEPEREAGAIPDRGGGAGVLSLLVLRPGCGLHGLPAGVCVGAGAALYRHHHLFKEVRETIEGGEENHSGDLYIWRQWDAE